MGLANLYNLPNTPVQRSKFSFNNADLHIRTNQRIFNLTGLRLTCFNLDPMPEDRSLFDGWLWSHQASHNEINVALSTTGNDLTDVDFSKEDQLKAWIWLHQSEHMAWEKKLGSSLG